MSTPNDIVGKIEQKLRKTKARARVEDLIDEWTEAFGGVKKIAQIFVAEFKDGRAGGIGRAKILHDYVQLLSLNSKKDSSRPVSEMGEDEAMAVFRELHDKLMQSTPIVKEADPGTQTPPPS